MFGSAVLLNVNFYNEVNMRTKKYLEKTIEILNQYGYSFNKISNQTRIDVCSVLNKNFGIYNYRKSNKPKQLRMMAYFLSLLGIDTPMSIVVNPRGILGLNEDKLILSKNQRIIKEKINKVIVTNNVNTDKERLNTLTSRGYLYSRENAIKLYKSEEWRSLRYEVLKEQGGVCQLCGRSKKHGVVLHVDHIKPLSKNWELRLTKSNLQVLCEDCNLGKSNKDCIDWR